LSRGDKSALPRQGRWVLGVSNLKFLPILSR
jgi:hypothetical protein